MATNAVSETSFRVRHIHVVMFLIYVIGVSTAFNFQHILLFINVGEAHTHTPLIQHLREMGHVTATNTGVSCIQGH
jgi:hypothetical protein